jgi:hypothetical protein
MSTTLSTVLGFNIDRISLYHHCLKHSTQFQQIIKDGNEWDGYTFDEFCKFVETFDPEIDTVKSDKLDQKDKDSSNDTDSESSVREKMVECIHDSMNRLTDIHYPQTYFSIFLYPDDLSETSSGYTTDEKDEQGRNKDAVVGIEILKQDIYSTKGQHRSILDGIQTDITEAKIELRKAKKNNGINRDTTLRLFSVLNCCS